MGEVDIWRHRSQTQGKEGIVEWLAGVVGVALLLLIFADESGKKNKNKRKWRPGELQVRGGTTDWVVMESGTFEIVFRSEEQEDCWQYIKDHTDW